MIATAAPPVVRRTHGELLAYLRQRLGVADLRYRKSPTPLLNGWETNTYRLQLESREPLPPAFARPVLLRAYTNRRGLPRLRHEFAVQRHLWPRGYPVAAPLLLEEDDSLLGGPFMFMEWVPGQTLLEFLFTHPTGIWGYPARMAELQVHLNTLPVGDFPAPGGEHLPRSLAELAAMIREGGFRGMEAGLDWLHTHRPAPPASPCIIHLDFHPLNLLVADGRFRAVLDWSDADVGDYHADVAATLLLIDTAPVELKTVWRWLMSIPGQGLLRRRYLRAYRGRLPIDDHKLRYYRAWAAFRRLAVWGRWLYLGPHVTGAKASTVSKVTPERLGYLARYFENWSGVAVSLPSRRGAVFNTGSNLAPA
jgi:aminoglycoside phosphotransferase (APT) family kinase protein